MEENKQSTLPKRVVRTITLTQDDLSLLDGIERVMSRTGQRIKTDSKLIRAAIHARGLQFMLRQRNCHFLKLLRFQQNSVLGVFWGRGIRIRG